MPKTDAIVPGEQHFILLSLPPSGAQKRLAFALVFGILAIYFIAVGPLSDIPPYPIAAFIPSYTTAMFVTEALTAILLFAQFSILRGPAILVIASGYLFTAAILIPWILTFPGVFGSTSLIGGMQSTVWLYVFWHAGFPMFVIGYALLKDADPSKQFWHGSVGVQIALSVAVTTAGVLVVTFICTAGEALLPQVMLDSLHFGPLWPIAGAPVVLLSTSALIALWLRISGVIAGSLVLICLLYEISNLYATLLAAIFAQRREREARLMTGDTIAAAIAHEVKQPLTAMVTSADAGFRFLDRSTPNLDRAKEAFKLIAADGHRAGAVVENIRANFRSDVRTRISLDVNELIREALALERSDLEKHRIRVQAEPNKRLPEVRGNQVQLQQVLLNLITNAIEAMAGKDEPRVLCVKSEAHEGDSVMVSVLDTGIGVSPQDTDRIFNTLFTTKPDGMGMGLSICRAIIEAHNGRLWFSPNTPRGAVFQFTLHANKSVSASG
ncbi:MAG: GHKL domain-containing protein [Betaproteobacteria bacterium]|nr:MAG: GHKL domain-containing protein [Betaproteobacteria bacterium]